MGSLGVEPKMHNRPNTNLPCKIGRVNIDLYRERKYRLRWTVEGKREALTVSDKTDPNGFYIAETIARHISDDLINGTYKQKSEYDPKEKVKQNIERLIYSNLKTLWYEYIPQRQDYSNSTNKVTNKRVEKWLDELPEKALLLENAHLLLDELRGNYSDSTIDRTLQSITACVNYWVKLGKVSKNPYPILRATLSPKNINKTKGRFTKAEQQAIIDAFRNNDYSKKSSIFPDSYYWHFIEFLFLTGLRPEEAIALTWSDVKWNINQIIINKTYSNNSRRNNTKQGKGNKEVHRIYLMNKDVRKCLERIVHRHSNLIFSSCRNGGYINQKNFSRRYWQRVVKGLVADGKVKKYLRMYCTRHTFITNQVLKLVPLHIIASQVGTSVKMIVKTYLVSNEWWHDEQLPDQYQGYKF